MNFTTESLTIQEIKTLRKEIFRAYITGILTGVMVAFLLSMVLIVKNSALRSGDYYFLLMLIAGAIFITSITVKNLQIDLYKGIKHIYKYQITEKHSYLDYEPGIGSDKMKYFLISEEKKFSVSEEEYKYAQVNDFVQEHEAPKSGYSLKIVVLKNLLFEVGV